MALFSSVIAATVPSINSAAANSDTLTRDRPFAWQPSGT